MTNAEYHAATGISSSDFRLLEKSPLHYENRELFKLEGDRLNLGSLVHKMVLEPDTVEEEFAREDFEGCDLNKNSKAYKEAKAEWLESVGDRTIVPVNMWQQAERMAGNVMAIAGGLLQNGAAEESIFVDDPLYEIKRKCRPDYYREDLQLVIDLKTTGDATEWGFSSSIQKYRYHRQAAWYLDTLRMAGKEVSRFVFVAVETAAPHMVTVFEIDQIAIDAGRDDYNALLQRWYDYKLTGRANVVRPISLPNWAA